MRYISDEDYKRIMKKMVPIDKIQIFSSEQECLEHERHLNEEKVKREKLIAEKNKRKDEVMAAYNNFIKLSHEFTDDYDESLTFDSGLTDLLYPFIKSYPRRLFDL